MSDYAQAFPRDLDGQWQGSIFASDGNCYFASSSHSSRRGAIFCKYDPRTARITVLADDITTVCNEDPAKTPPQGKIHSPFVEANGWIYLLTHLANYWAEGCNNYTGAHVVGYELATGRFRDFGVIHPRYSGYSAIAVDPVRNCIYAFVTPFAAEDKNNGGSHIYRIDIATGKKQDLGQIGKRGSTSFYFFLDDQGNCWSSLNGSNGNLYRIRRDSDTIEVFENVLPRRGQSTTQPSTRPAARYWTWAAPMDGGRRGLILHEGALWVFDPSKDPSSPEAFKLLNRIGGAGLGTALAGGRVYFSQGRRGGLVSLKSVALTPDATVIDHGIIVDQDGRSPLPSRLEQLAADGKGLVFMTGDWSVLNDGERLTRHREGRAVSVVTSRPATQESDDFEFQNRAQRFGVADVSEDLK
jgi:hypothetical protein